MIFKYFLLHNTDILQISTQNLKKKCSSSREQMIQIWQQDIKYLINEQTKHYLPKKVLCMNFSLFSSRIKSKASVIFTSG